MTPEERLNWIYKELNDPTSLWDVGLWQGSPRVQLPPSSIERNNIGTIRIYDAQEGGNELTGWRGMFTNLEQGERCLPLASPIS